LLVDLFAPAHPLDQISLLIDALPMKLLSLLPMSVSCTPQQLSKEPSGLHVPSLKLQHPIIGKLCLLH
jgi:hypothetical protein